MESPFDVLEVDPGADEAEVERAYRRRVKETHPDRGGSVRQFLRVRAAYEEITSGDGGDLAVADERPDDAARGASGNDVGPRASGNGAGSTAPGGEPEGSEAMQVEYLNYEVLDDQGWALDDDNLFERAAADGLDQADHGRISVPPSDSLLEAAEDSGCTWPYACRGGACANCAVAVLEGDLSMPVDHILPSEMLDRGIRLSCVGSPTTDRTKVVYNVKHLPDLDELRLPPRPFRQASRGR